MSIDGWLLGRRYRGWFASSAKVRLCVDRLKEEEEEEELGTGSSIADSIDMGDIYPCPLSAIESFVKGPDVSCVNLKKWRGTLERIFWTSNDKDEKMFLEFICLPIC